MSQPYISPVQFDELLSHCNRKQPVVVVDRNLTPLRIEIKPFSNVLPHAPLPPVEDFTLFVDYKEHAPYSRSIYIAKTTKESFMLAARYNSDSGDFFWKLLRE